MEIKDETKDQSKIIEKPKIESRNNLQEEEKVVNPALINPQTREQIIRELDPENLDAIMKQNIYSPSLDKEFTFHLEK